MNLDDPLDVDGQDLDDDDDELLQRVRGRTASQPWFFAMAAAAFLGAAFSAVSTSDFISHLDRQVHSIHCSFIPGAGNQIGSSGCRTVMMSPYSSLFRQSLWGGLPISLLALAVFAYLVYRALDLALRRDITKRDTMFAVLATLLPVGMSAIYATISISEIGTLCKLCVGVYSASTFAFIAALIGHRAAPRGHGMRSPGALYGRWFAEGVGYVAVLVFLYVSMAPASAKTEEGCGRLVRTNDKHGILVPYAGKVGGAPAIAVLDPLCPACRAFDKRLFASGLPDQLELKVALFPLDSSCNWMVQASLHPGACAVSEAILCKPESATEIVEWAFENQEELLESAKTSDRAVRKAIVERFSSVRRCLGSSKVKNKLNKSLKWAVANALPVLTPQLFIGDRRVCDEDTDLGLEYTVATMLKGAK